MCTTYQAFGAVGLITSGAGRDLDQVRARDFPVFTSGTICSHGYPQIVDVHVPVHVGGMPIFADELLHGDRNGVTTIPREIVPDLVDVADEFVAAEEVVLETMRREPGDIQRLREARAESKTRIDNLRRRVSRA
jgi:regulator of RNase E activity RraA